MFVIPWIEQGHNSETIVGFCDTDIERSMRLYMYKVRTQFALTYIHRKKETNTTTEKLTILQINKFQGHRLFSSAKRKGRPGRDGTNSDSCRRMHDRGDNSLGTFPTRPLHRIIDRGCSLHSGRIEVYRRGIICFHF